MIPSNLLRHTIVVEAYAGDGAYGPLYAPPVEVACWLDQKTRMVRDSQGRQVTSTSTAYCNPGPVVTTQSRITLADDRQPEVIAVLNRNSGGLVRIDHLEIQLA